MNRIFIIRKVLILSLAIALTSASQHAIAQGALIMKFGEHAARLLRDTMIIDGVTRGFNAIQDYNANHQIDDGSSFSGGIPPNAAETIFMPPFGPILPGQSFTPFGQ